MEPIEYELMYAVEDDHWWYRGMALISKTLLQRFLPARSDLKILDAGCGTGAAMGTFLAERGAVTGVDVAMVPLKYCRMRNLTTLTCASVDQLPFAAESFDLVSSFDVLYAREVPEVKAALKEFTRVISPPGYLLLRLPAYDWLRGRHDRAVHTARRFTLRQTSELLQQCGLRIVHRSYANMFLFPVALMKRWLERIHPQNDGLSDLAVADGGLGKLFYAVLAFEALLIPKICLPFGLSLVLVAQKESS